MRKRVEADYVITGGSHYHMNLVSVTNDKENR